MNKHSVRFFIKLLFFIFLISCKEASFTTQEGLNSYTFDSFSTEDQTMHFEIQRSNEPSDDTLVQASLNNGIILEHPNESKDSPLAEFSFQNSVVAYKTLENTQLSFLITPYISEKPILNLVSSALYLKIKNSLSHIEFNSLVVNNAQWSTLLRTYENFCQSCLGKSLEENLKLLNKDSTLWTAIKNTLGANLSWSHKAINEWGWIILNTSPKFTHSKKINLVEGESYNFQAELFHPSKTLKILNPTSWSHNFNDINTLVSFSGKNLNQLISHNQDLNNDYTLTFSSLSQEGLPDLIYQTFISFDNTNRPAELSNGASLPIINLTAGQERQIDLTQYFQDPDNPSEILFLKILNENEIFKLIGISDLLIYGPATHFFIGNNEVKFTILDSEEKESEVQTLFVNITPNSPPQISYIYKNNNPNIKYYNNDVIDFEEGVLDQSFTIVSTDIDGDRTTVELLDKEIIKSNFSHDPPRTFGVIEPRASNWSFDYLKNGFFSFTPGDPESELRFIIRPSYYQNNNVGQKTFDLDFKVKSSHSYQFINNTYIYTEIPLSTANKDDFRIKIRVLNKDDAPIRPGTQTSQNINEAQPFNINLLSIITPTDLPTSSSLASLAFQETSCDWINYNNNNTLTGIPPLDAPAQCTATFYIHDSANNFHGVALAPINLRTSSFNVNIPITNLNHTPHLINGGPTDLGSVNESNENVFYIPLLDITPGNGVFNGHFGDFDHNFTDPNNPFVDPLEVFEFNCFISIENQNNYTECNESGLFFVANGLEQAVLRPSHSMVYNKSFEKYDVKISFKDRESLNFIHKIFKLEVINRPAPLDMNFSNTSKIVGEGVVFNADLRIDRFSDDPIDIYPFQITVNCFGCTNMLKSSSLISFENIAFESQSTFIVKNIFETNYSHGDGDENSENYIIFSEAKSLNSSYTPGSPLITPEVLSSGQMALEVLHVNLPPSAISINQNSNSSLFLYDVNRATKGGVIEVLPVTVIDPDQQDLLFATSSNGLSGGVVSFQQNKIFINYSLCPIGGRTLIKHFTIIGADPAGLTKTRNVTVKIRNVDTFSGTCD